MLSDINPYQVQLPGLVCRLYTVNPVFHIHCVRLKNDGVVTEDNFYVWTCTICFISGCDPPKTTIPHGIVYQPMKARYMLNDVITYRCRDSDFQGTRSVTCQNDGTFTTVDKYPQCNAGTV